MCSKEIGSDVKVARAEVKEVGTKDSSEESGKHYVNPTWMAIWSTEKVLH